MAISSAVVNRWPTASLNAAMMRSLKSILEQLQKHRQRATYGAVAELTNRTPRTVMQGCPRNFLHSWVVNQQSGQPTEYPPGMIHPDLETNTGILKTAPELESWLAAYKRVSAQP